MNNKIILILIIILIPTVFLYSDNVIAVSSNEIIKVSIIKGPPDYFAWSQYEPQYNALDSYTWTVNDNTYEFKPKIYINEFNEYNEQGIYVNNRSIFLSNDSTDVLVNDGGSLDGTLGGMRFPLLSKPIKDNYRTYLENGGGYIGVCGGGEFPLPLIKKPNTAIELFSVHRNSFIENMETKTDVNYGNPIFSEYLGIIEINNGYRRFFRIKSDPNAQGVGAYFNMHLTEPETNISKVYGIPVNLTNLDKTHPIFKDYWGDTLFYKALNLIIHEGKLLYRL